MIIPDLSLQPFFSQNGILQSVLVNRFTVFIIYERNEFLKFALFSHTEFLTELLARQVIVFGVGVDSSDTALIEKIVVIGFSRFVHISMVQLEIERRRKLGNTYSGKSVLSAKLICEDCGSFYGSKVWHSTDKYKRTVWRCNNKFDKDKHCQTPTLDTEAIQKLFIKAYNELMQNQNQIISDCQLMRKVINNTEELDSKISAIAEEIEVVTGLVKAAIKENASTEQSQEQYLKKYNTLSQRYEKLTGEYEQLQSQKEMREKQDKAMALFIRTLKKQPIFLTEWDDTIWTVMVEKATVHKDGKITFIFYNGTEITVGE